MSLVWNVLPFYVKTCAGRTTMVFESFHMWGSSLASKLKQNRLLAFRTFFELLPGWSCCADSRHRRIHPSTERRTLGIFNTKITSSAGLFGKVRRASCPLPRLLSFSLNSSCPHPLPPPHAGSSLHRREDGDASSHVRVCLMTYDTQVHLYDLSPVLSRPHMLVITDTEELQLPVREGLLVPLKDCIDALSR